MQVQILSRALEVWADSHRRSASVLLYNGTMKRHLVILASVVAASLAGCTGQGDGGVGEPMATAVRRVPWNSPETSGSQLITQHYSIYTTTTDQALVTYLPGFMEAAYRNYLHLTSLPEQGGEPMPIYMMASRQEWASLTESVVGKEAAGPYLSLQAGGYCHKGVCVFWDIGVLGTFSVGAHEGMHQFFHHRLRDRLPMWLEEGLCTTAEGYQVTGDSVTFTPQRNTIRFADLRTAIVQGRWIPLGKLLSMDSSDAVVGGTERATGYYGQLWAMVQFIRSEAVYRAGMERMLTDAVAGRFGEVLSEAGLATRLGGGRGYNQAVSEPLFARYISPDLDGFEKEFRAFATKLARL